MDNDCQSSTSHLQLSTNLNCTVMAIPSAQIVLMDALMDEASPEASRIKESLIRRKNLLNYSRHVIR